MGVTAGGYSKRVPGATGGGSASTAAPGAPGFGFPENQLSGFKRSAIVFLGGGAVSLATGSGAVLEVLTVGAVSVGACDGAEEAAIGAGAGFEAGCGSGVLVMTTVWVGGGCVGG